MNCLLVHVTFTPTVCSHHKNSKTQIQVIAASPMNCRVRKKKKYKKYTINSVWPLDELADSADQLAACNCLSVFLNYAARSAWFLRYCVLQSAVASGYFGHFQSLEQ